MYPLDEGTTVVGFEAAVSQRTVTVQIKDKAKTDVTYFDSCSLPPGKAADGSGEGVEGVLENVGRKGRKGEWGGDRGWLAGVCCCTKGAPFGRLRGCGAHAKSVSLTHLEKHCCCWAAKGVMQKLRLFRENWCVQWGV